MGILAMHDARLGFEKAVFIKETLKIDESLRPTMLGILGNMMLTHGYQNVSRWFAGGSDPTEPGDDFCRVVTGYMDSPVSEAYTACLHYL
ncbi:unnamed protein product [Gongylonema pulchrum]|uniref:Acyl-CoA dehydrogenase n=1 Tax=Gongylonema pulchrum TaxID=637853 RepID=A0A183DKT2_9BILA|nr:unnamed protein product [Gongylonema pulchrum]